jgi:predicted TPR repeat methyltransferase
MIEIARTRRAYDALYVAEITAFLTADARDTFHLITACDTLIYFGDLRQVIAPASRWLRPGGVIVLTVERGESYPFQLTDSGRYAHHANHVEEAAGDSGLIVVSVREAVLRHEYGSEVQGLVAVLMSRDEEALGTVVSGSLASARVQQ